VVDGRGVDTTMGFTPTGGVMMGTRRGDLDPGVLVHFLRNEQMSAPALDELLNKRSGLLGVSGTTGDMADLLARGAADPNAAEAVALFCRTVKKAIGALAAVLGGVDTLVFAGGIGEHAAPVRARIAEGLGHLGIRLDEARNAASHRVISAEGGACTVRVIATDEESVIVRETLSTLAAGEGADS
jgi:acetate kinase